MNVSIQILLKMLLNMVMKLKILFFLLLSSNFAWAQNGNPSGNIGGMPAYHIDDLWRLSVGLSYSLQTQENFNSSSLPSVSSNAKAQFNLENGIAFELDARLLAQKSWGLISGFNIDLGRAVTSGTLTSSSGTAFSYSTVDSPKLQTTLLYAEVAYRWKHLYIPFGINYGIFKYSPRSIFSGSTSTTGGLGAQLGIGSYLLSQLPIELTYRMIPITHSLTPTSGVVEDYGSGFLTSLLLTAKFVF